MYSKDQEGEGGKPDGAAARRAWYGRTRGAGTHSRERVRGADRRARLRVRASQPGRAPGRVRVRLLEVLCEEPEAVSGSRGYRGGLTQPGGDGPGRGSQDRCSQVPRLRARGARGGASRYPAPLAGRPRSVPDRVQLYVRGGVTRLRTAHRACGTRPKRPDVRH